MTTIKEILEHLESLTPFELAESWDNVGLLVGDLSRTAKQVMTCLTITGDVVEEAISRGVDLIVTHHPLPFQALKKITADTTTGRLLLSLIEAKISIISPHTGFDSAQHGINQMLAEKFELQKIRPLICTNPEDSSIGKGRVGKLSTPTDLEDFIERVKNAFGMDTVKTVGETGQELQTVAVACGSGGTFLDDAIGLGCDTFITGEASFHACLEARTRQVVLILLGHFASERFALEVLAERLAVHFPGTSCWASERESDPIRWR